MCIRDRRHSYPWLDGVAPPSVDITAIRGDHWPVQLFAHHFVLGFSSFIATVVELGLALFHLENPATVAVTSSLDCAAHNLSSASVTRFWSASGVTIKREKINSLAWAVIFLWEWTKNDSGDKVKGNKNVHIHFLQMSKYTNEQNRPRGDPTTIIVVYSKPNHRR